MSVAYGGQVLLSNTSVEQLHNELPSGITLRDMKEHRLKGLPEPERLWQMIAPGLQLDFPPLQSLTEIPNNLPTQPTPFIGRATQIVVIKELLQRADVHLVTLLGPGGTGKTRLSLQVAQEMLTQFHHGVFFVPLADDTNANELISRVAQQLAVREGGRSLLESVKDYLRDKNILLVLDNFEQLVSAALIVADLLANASQLKILVSSRVALNLRGEREFPVPPLELPQTENELSVEHLMGNESVTLFIDRAQAVQPSFTLTHDNVSAVTDICRRLDGLPLALELAAARVKLLAPRAILARLDDRLKLLTGGARDLPARHQTLRNTLEWSYSLLNEDEKILYARLSVFVGGFTLEAAEAVCNAKGRLDIPEGLTSLMNNSLVRQEESVGGEPRLTMLETIRAYALERLAESGEMEALRAGHAQYYGELLLSQASYGIYYANLRQRELDNIRATLSWCAASTTGIDLGARLVWVLQWFWYRVGYFSEGRLWTKQILASPFLPEGSKSHAMALGASGFLAVWQGEQETGLVQIENGLTIARRLNDEQMMPILLMTNAIACISMGRDHTAQPLLREALELFEQQNLPYFHIITIVLFGNVQFGLGNVEQAQALYEEAAVRARSLVESWILSFALSNLGEVARIQGQYELAGKYYEECETLIRDTGDTGDLARFVHNLGYIAQHAGDFSRAESQFRKSLTIFQRLGNRRGMAECIAGLAGLKVRQGDIEWGAIALSAAESMLKATGGEWWPADRLEVEANQEIISSALGKAERTVAQKKGKAMTLEQALAFASEGQTLS
jgi:predicted ATPase